MSTEKSILVLGGTGAMGRYLVPKLADDGYRVDVVSLDDWTSDRPNLRYLKANAMNRGTRTELLSRHYDGIVDFMIYNTTPMFREMAPQLLENTDHYIYLSTYRVFDESPVTDEKSPQLWDTVCIRRAGRTFCSRRRTATGRSFALQSPIRRNAAS